MELLLIYIATIIASILIKIKSILDMCKDIANNGYKIDYDNVIEVNKNIEDIEVNKFGKYAYLIPIYNLYKVLFERLKYKNNREFFLSDLDVNPAFKKLNDFETLDYLKKPTGFNALMAPIKFQRRLEKALFLEIKDGSHNGEIYYEINDEDDEIVILSSTVDAAKYSVEEQKNIVYEYWGRLVLEGLKRYGTIDNLVEEVKENPSFDFTLYNLNINENTIKDNFLDTNELVDKAYDNIDNDKGYSLKRKR